MAPVPHAGTTPVLCWFRVFYRDRLTGRVIGRDETLMVHAAKSQYLLLEVEVAARGLPMPRWAQSVTHVQLTQYLPRCETANF
jgi:hypothetical protein